jgi:hypothetical protein
MLLASQIVERAKVAECERHLGLRCGPEDSGATCRGPSSSVPVTALPDDGTAWPALSLPRTSMLCAPPPETAGAPFRRASSAAPDQALPGMNRGKSGSSPLVGCPTPGVHGPAQETSALALPVTAAGGVSGWRRDDH